MPLRTSSSTHARRDSSSSGSGGSPSVGGGGGGGGGGAFAGPVPPSPSSVTAGFSPGGQVPSGYSYLHRSHSLLTPTRRNVPSGLGKGEKDSSSTNKPVVLQTQAAPQSAPPPPPPPPYQRLQRSNTSTSVTSQASSEPDSVQSRRASEQETVAALVAKLPANPKAWTPSQVALYLTHVLGLTPKPIVEDVTAYVRRAHMGGRVFLRLKASDLEEEGLNTKWRRLMIEAVKKLRRDCLRGRIWGHEGGMQWPRQDDMLEEDTSESQAAAAAAQVPRPAFAMGTLKRLRDKKQVKGMIESFEAGDHIQEDGAVTPRSPIIVRRDSVDSLASLSRSASSSPREPMAPIYGEGYVKQRAESFTSLSELSAEEASHKRRHFEKAELEHWFGTLTEQEAAALVSELEDDDLKSEGDEEGGHDAGLKFDHGHQRSTSSHSDTGESAPPGTPPPHSPLAFTPLDASLVQAIIGEAGEADEASPSNAANTSSKVSNERAAFGLGLAMVPPARRIDIDLEDETEAEAAARRHAHLRPGLSNGGRSNPYRSSTYDAEELQALGIGGEGEEEDIKYGTARKIAVRSPPIDEDDSGLLADNEMEMPAARGSIRIRSPPATNREDSRGLFAALDAEPAPAVATNPAARDVEDAATANVGNDVGRSSHMRHMSAHEASGADPYKPLSPGVSRRASTKKRQGGDTNLDEDADAMPPSSLASMANEMTKAATFGRKAGSRRSGQLKQLVALQSAQDDEDRNSQVCVAAEDEAKWGGTLSRKNSRRGNPVALQLQQQQQQNDVASSTAMHSGLFAQPQQQAPRENLRQRMMDLFSPVIEQQAESEKEDSNELSAENLQTLTEQLSQQLVLNASVDQIAEDHSTPPTEAKSLGEVEMLSVPLTTLAPSPDGKGSIKKTSMVLVERKRFESLARRMGVLEEQLAQLENLTEAGSVIGAESQASLSSNKAHGRRRTALEEVFTIPQHAGQVSKDMAREEASLAPVHKKQESSDEDDALSWRYLPFGRHFGLGAIPSYALGLAAGAGFVLLSEVLGRGRP